MTGIQALAPFPETFRQRLTALVPGDRLSEVIAGYTAPRLVGLRPNPLQADPGQTLVDLRAQGFDLVPLPTIPGAFILGAERRRAITETAQWRDGAIYLQNPASMLPPLVLGPTAADRVLDLAAAPGSKTLQMAAMMQNQGWISAVESVRDRFFHLRANLLRQGARNVHSYLKDGTGVWRLVGEGFDKVLLDAPCSAEGQFHVEAPASYAYWSEKKILDMSRKQKRLLYSAIRCLKPGGRLVYATCTLAPEENEAVVDAMLKTFGEERLRVDSIDWPGVSSLPGLPRWQGKKFHPDLVKCLRLLPSPMMEGFFLCRLFKPASTADMD